MRNILKENVFCLLKTLSKQDPNLGLKLRLKKKLFFNNHNLSRLAVAINRRPNHVFIA